jgi:hypothetical protein
MTLESKKKKKKKKKGIYHAPEGNGVRTHAELGTPFLGDGFGEADDAHLFSVSLSTLHSILPVHPGLR